MQRCQSVLFDQRAYGMEPQVDTPKESFNAYTLVLAFFLKN